jgi:ElaB/YqjD/DUF883 family membrane-anchored ribosome-binding protein
MAEKSTELKKVEDLDPVSTAAGLERYEATDSYELSSDEAPEDTEQIKAQIEQTRSQMGDTIDAIQDRLSVANISEQVSERVNSAIETAKDTAYDATIGKAVNFMKNVGDDVSHSGAFRAVKKNPLPLALIGLGAGLLAYQSYSGKSSRRGGGRSSDKNFYSDGSRAANYATSGSAMRGIGETASRAFDGISHKAGSALESVGGSASAALDSVSTSAGAAYESVTGVVSNAYSEAGELAHRAYDRAGEYGTIAYDKYDEVLEENPLALGAVALALGAAVGFSIPSTKYEGKLMGEARENLVQRAQDAAGSIVDKAKQVASEAGQTIKQETRTLVQ